MKKVQLQIDSADFDKGAVLNAIKERSREIGLTDELSKNSMFAEFGEAGSSYRARIRGVNNDAIIAVFIKARRREVVVTLKYRLLRASGYSLLWLFLGILIPPLIFVFFFKWIKGNLDRDFEKQVQGILKEAVANRRSQVQGEWVSP